MLMTDSKHTAPKWASERTFINASVSASIAWAGSSGGPRWSNLAYLRLEILPFMPMIRYVNGESRETF